MASHAPLAPRGTNGNGEFIPMTAHIDVKCMLRRYLHLSATDPTNRDAIPLLVKNFKRDALNRPF